MKRAWPLALLGLGAFLLFAITTLPASVVLSRLADQDVHAGGVSGTLWRGEAQVMQVGSVMLGEVKWRVHALPLLIARVSVDIEARRSDGFANAHLSLMPGGRLHARDIAASLPLTALPAQLLQGGWRGAIGVRLDELSLQDGWPTQAVGTVDVMDLSGPAQQPMDLGSYRISFLAATEGEALSGALQDAGDGPLEVSGSLRLQPDRNYELNALLKTRPSAPPTLTRSLEFLSPPDEQGRREFSMAGSM